MNSKHHSIRNYLMALVLALPAWGCGDDADPGDDGGHTAPDAGDGSPDAVTFTEVFEQVLEDGGCAVGMCHSSAASGDLRLDDPDVAYDALVNAPATGELCENRGLIRVVPNQPDQSLLLMKLTDTQECGDPMPITGLLEPEDIDLVRRWIEAGAPND